MQTGTVMKAFGATAALVILYEHTARMRNWPEKYHVSYQLGIVGDKLVRLWKRVGVLIARASGLYRHLGLDKLASTCVALASPILTIASSPTAVLLGYVEYASEHVGTTVFGTVLLGVVGYFAYNYSQEWIAVK